jgi:hypothetical protein
MLLITVIGIDAEKLNNNIEECGLPPSFSWQNINGIDYTTPIKDQSPAPTCEAYALCAALETMMQYKVGELYEPDVSDCHLYFYAGGTVEKGYVNLIDAANYLIDIGVPDEGCYPDPHRAFDYPFESLEGWENRTVKITDWGWVDMDIESIKTALINYGPLIICISVYQDYFYYKEGVYRHEWGERVGGHVVTIVGYNDNNNCWIVKNSWGEKWGEDGWFRLAYDADIFAEWYGEGLAIMYLDGVYGNLKPDVPRINIEKPIKSHTYFFGIELPIIFKKLKIQKAAPRIIGKMPIKLKTENTKMMEFYVDDVLVSTDYGPPFEWNIKISPGLHTIKAFGYNNVNVSYDIVDVFIFI